MGQHMSNDAIRLRSLTRRYSSGGASGTALDQVSLAFPSGTFTAVMGPSGSGKSTLLQCAAGLDRPTSGSVTVGDTELTGLSETKLTLLRRERIGFVFQAFNLLPSLTAEQNVALPLRMAGRRPRKTQVREVLEQVGLGDRTRHRCRDRADRPVGGVRVRLLEVGRHVRPHAYCRRSASLSRLHPAQRSLRPLDCALDRRRSEIGVDRRRAVRGRRTRHRARRRSGSAGDAGAGRGRCGVLYRRRGVRAARRTGRLRRWTRDRGSHVYPLQVSAGAERDRVAHARLPARARPA